MVIPIALVGNKSDLCNAYSIDSIPIEKDTINIYLKQFTQILGIEIPYIETRAKTAKGKSLLLTYLVNFYKYIFLLKSFKEIKVQEITFTKSIRHLLSSTRKKYQISIG